MAHDAHPGYGTRVRVFVSALASIAALTLVGCVKRPQIRDFEHTGFSDHPLVGLIWDSREGGFTRRRTLEAAVREHALVLLGETHDNADHHRIQAALLSVWLESHPQGRVAFEQLDEAQGRALAAHPLRSSADVRRYSQWDQSGWPSFSLYAPLFAIAVDTPAGPLAAHPTAETLRSAMVGEGPPPSEDLKLLPPPAQPLMDALRQEIINAHCGHTPGPMLEPMVEAQRLKDAWMARAMAQAEAPAVALIAGAGHVRRDRGVPYYLARQGLDDVVSIAMLPVAEGYDAPEDYEADAYDLVVFTPATSTLSACDRFREQLERMRAQRPHEGPPEADPSEGDGPPAEPEAPAPSP